MIVRQYRSEDLDTVVSLWYRSWNISSPDVPHPLPFEAWAPRFEREIVPKGTISIAEVDGRIAGFIVFVYRDSYIDQLYVDPDFLGRGIGTLLLERAKAASPEGLALHALQQNTRAHTFYEKHWIRGRGDARQSSERPDPGAVPLDTACLIVLPSTPGSNR